MKKLYIIFMLAAAIALSGCTQNNGRIGHWFGMWKVERLTIDGEDDPQYAGNVFFSFQSKVFGLTVSDFENSQASQYYGRWEEGDGVLSVEFDVGDNVPQALLKLHLEKESRFKIVHADGKEKTLELVGNDGKTYAYYLKSW